jgi:hypothetical protein
MDNVQVVNCILNLNLMGDKWNERNLNLKGDSEIKGRKINNRIFFKL